MKPEGLLLVDKPQGVTSYHVVEVVKRKSGIRKVGHGGTLDPFATGLLVVLVGRSCTKSQSEFMVGKKRYIARLRLGIRTDTGDPTGRVIEQYSGPLPSRDRIVAALEGFLGEIWQRPHPYSAVKYKGKPLYYYTRRGIDVPISPRKVQVFSLTLKEVTGPVVDIDLTVSGGFYVRSFAEDLGRKLDVPAMTEALRRVSIGKLHVDDAVTLERLNSLTPQELAGLLKGC